jgi:hypothetical protein
LFLPKVNDRMENQMKRKCLAIGISTVSVIILILTSLTNVVGYQTVQTSQQNIIKERINQRELLFQTIVDIVNNKEIQRIILKSQMSRGVFPTSEFPVVTKNQLKMMYFIGLLLSKVVSKSRLQSMIGKYQFSNQEIQKEISAVIEKNAILKAELIQFKNSDCDCEEENTIEWHFPVICIILSILTIITGASMMISILYIDSYFLANFFAFLLMIIGTISTILNCLI